MSVCENNQVGVLKVVLAGIACGIMLACGAPTGIGDNVDVDSIAVSVATTKPAVGDNLRITAKPLNRSGALVPGAICSFQSSNTAIATVDNSGNVQALATGAVEIVINCSAATTRVHMSVHITAASQAMLGTYRLTLVNGGSPTIRLGLFNGTSGAEVYVSASALTLQWDTVSYLQKMSYSVTATYKSFDSGQGTQIWTDARLRTGTWSLANNLLTLKFFPETGGFSVTNPVGIGQTLTTTLTNLDLLGSVGGTVALQLSR